MSSVEALRNARDQVFALSCEPTVTHRALLTVLTYLLERNEASGWRAEAIEARQIANAAMAAGLAECERLRSEIDRLATLAEDRFDCANRENARANKAEQQLVKWRMTSRALLNETWLERDAPHD